MGISDEFLHMEVHGCRLYIRFYIIRIYQLFDAPPPCPYIGLTDQGETKPSLFQLLHNATGVGRDREEKGSRMDAGGDKGDNILFRFVEKSSVPDGRIRGSEKEKRACAETEPYPDDVDGNIDCAEAPVFPVKQSYKKGAIGQAAVHT